MKNDTMLILKKEFKEFKENEESGYKERIVQSEFTTLAKEIILETLKNEPLKEKYLTGFIQMFKWNCSVNNFEHYISQNLNDKNKSDRLLDKFSNLNEWGYTAVGMASVHRKKNILNSKHLLIIKKFLEDAFKVKSITQAKKLVDDFEFQNIPLVTVGIYSPWLHYINPKIFPILNSRVRTLLKLSEIEYKYSICISDFSKLLKEFSEENLGIIDSFAWWLEQKYKV